MKMSKKFIIFLFVVAAAQILTGYKAEQKLYGKVVLPGRFKAAALFLNTEELTAIREQLVLFQQKVRNSEEYIEAAELPQSMALNVPELLQNPELPTGCESVALSILLLYRGYQITKTTIADEYLIYSKSGALEEGFVGNPHSWEGAGCFPSTIVDTANRFLKEQGAEESAKDLSGKEFDAILHYVASGRPVAVWTTMYLLNPEIDLQEEDSTEYTWYELEHCVVLAGYDLAGDTVLISDPLEGIVERSLSEFQSVYNKVGKFAVTLI